MSLSEIDDTKRPININDIVQIVELDLNRYRSIFLKSEKLLIRNKIIIALYKIVILDSSNLNIASGFPKNKKYRAVVKPTPIKSSPIRNPRIDRPINDLVNKAVQKIKANTKYVKIFLTESGLLIVCILFTLC